MDYTEIEIEGMKEILRDKEKEIKKLKEERDNWEKTATKFTNCIDTLEASIKNLEEENNKLKEEIRFLEECLDNKEKVNKSLREELEWYHGFDNYLTNHGFDMKNLKSELEIWKLTAKDYAKQCGVDLKDLDLI